MRDAALLYAALAALPAAMHVALALGAPLGAYTLGGRYPGRLPPALRGLAVVQAALLAGLAAAVLDRGGALALGLPPAAFPAALGLTLLSTAANLATPSRPERRLWGPVTLAMSAAALAVALRA